LTFCCQQIDNTILFSYHAFNRFGLEISASNPSSPWNPFSKPFRAFFSDSLDDSPGFSRPRLRCIALSEIHASKPFTISILKRSASNTSCQPPTERPFIRSAAFLTTIGPQLDPSFCWGVAYTTIQDQPVCNDIIQSFGTYRLNIFELQVAKLLLISHQPRRCLDRDPKLTCTVLPTRVSFTVPSMTPWFAIES
jgi:hypothetical protein